MVLIEIRNAEQNLVFNTEIPLLVRTHAMDGKKKVYLLTRNENGNDQLIVVVYNTVKSTDR